MPRSTVLERCVDQPPNTTHPRASRSGTPTAPQSLPALTTSRCRPRRLHIARLRRFRRLLSRSSQKPSVLGWLERQFLQQALVCRSVELFGSRPSPSPNARPCHEWRPDPQPTNLVVSCLSNARSGAHPDRCRGIRLDSNVDGSAHLLVHVLREDPSCRAIHHPVEFCFSRTQGSYLV